MDSSSDPNSTDKVPITDDNYITIIILVGGVVGGLFVVLVAIIFCKYCKPKKTLKRQYGIRRVETSTAEKKKFRPFIRPSDGYETIPSTSYCETQVSTLNETCREFVSKTDNSSDIEKDITSYQAIGESNPDQSAGIVRDNPEEDQHKNDKPEGGTRRKVSFKMKAITDTKSERQSTYATEGRRYTEGDYHHLKKSKLDKTRAFGKNILRQTTAPGRMMYEQQSMDGTFEKMDSNEQLDDSKITTPKINQQAIGHHQQNNRGQANTKNVTADVHYNASPVKLGDDESTLLLPPYRSPSHSPRDINGNRKCRGQENKKNSQSLEDVIPNGKQSPIVAQEMHSCEGAPRDDTKSTEQESFTCFGTKIPKSLFAKCTAFKVDLKTLKENAQQQTNNDDDINLQKLSVSESESDTLNGSHKYRELWSLRATLEEDENSLGDTNRQNDATMPLETETDENSTTYATSFESNTETGYTEPKTEHTENNVNPKSGNLLQLPSIERRRKYQNILNKRTIQRKESADNSFDSVSTTDVTSESSRPDMTTTSFETSTENTDSTNDSAAHKLQQLKHDSGYKSLENYRSQSVDSNRSIDIFNPLRLKKQIQFADKDSIEIHEIPEMPKRIPTEKIQRDTSTSTSSDSIGRQNTHNKTSHQYVLERRNMRTASKKRREFHRERQMFRIHESFHEPDTDSKSDYGPSGDSFDDNTQMLVMEENGPGIQQEHSSKLSSFRKFFRINPRNGSKEKLKMRDFSIDEKTNEIFNSFIQNESDYEINNASKYRLSNKSRNNNSKLQRKHTGSSPDSRHKLSSRNKDESIHKSKKFITQDSIEEEYLHQESAKTYEGISDSITMQEDELTK